MVNNVVVIPSSISCGVVSHASHIPCASGARGGSARSHPRCARSSRGAPCGGAPSSPSTPAPRSPLNHHHPMNDIVGVNTRAFKVAAAGACQVVDWKGELPALFASGREVVTYRDLHEPRCAATWTTTSPIPTRRARSARTRSSARWASTPCGTASRRSRPRWTAVLASASASASSLAVGLRCTTCGEAYPLAYRLECAGCRGLLELVYDEDALRRLGPGVLAGRGSGATPPCCPSPIRRTG